MISVIKNIFSPKVSPEQKFLEAVNTGNLKLAKKISRQWDSDYFKSIFVEKTDATPMHFAVQSKNRLMVTWLVQKGAIIDHPMKSSIGLTPLKIACNKSLTRLALYLLACGADPTIKNNVGKKPLESLYYQSIDKEFKSAFYDQALLLAQKKSASTQYEFAKNQLNLACKDLTKVDRELIKLVYGRISHLFITSFKHFKYQTECGLKSLPRDIRLIIWSHIPNDELITSHRMVSKEFNSFIISDLTHKFIMNSKFLPK